MTARPHFLVELENIEKEDIDEVGEPGYILSGISKANIPVPKIFIIPSSIYRDFIKQNGFHIKIPHLLAHIDFRHSDSIQSASNNIKKMFMEAQLEEDFIRNILRRYENLNGILKNKLFSILPSINPHTLHHPAPKNIDPCWGEANMLLKIREAWADAFSPEALVYRKQNDINHFKIGISLLIQRLINSDASGVFTIDKWKFENMELVIKSQLGIYAPEGQFDEYRLSINDGLINKKSVVNQTEMLKMDGNKIKRISIPQMLPKVQKISDENIQDILKLSKRLQDLYYLPKDYFFSIEKNRIYITNARPKASSDPETEKFDKKLIASGSPLAVGLGTGQVRIINTPRDLKKVTRSEILILKKELPGLKYVLSKCTALLFQEKVDKPQINHLLYKKSVPVVSDLAHIESYVRDGQVITVNGTKGFVTKGGPTAYDKTATKIYSDLSDVFPNDKSLVEKDNVLAILSGNSLIRSLGIHPKSFIERKSEAEFIKLLSASIENVLKLLHSKTLMYALSDLDSTDLRNLKNGKQFEAIEKNPFIGFKGAARHIRDKKPFLLELSAIKYIRETLGYKNLHLILPLVRSVQELREIAKIMRSENIYKSANLKIWMKVSTPLQAICISEFIEEGLDGIIVDTDSLHNLLSGVDKDNIELIDTYDKIDPALEYYIETIINTSKKHELPVSIYVSALLMQEKFIEKLIKLGASSIVVKPSQITWTKEFILKSERKIANKEL